MWKYYCPIEYTLVTRYKSLMNKISFFAFNLLPGIFFVFANNAISVHTFLYYCLAFTIMYSLYECGYLFNDVLTVMFEDKPSLRIEGIYMDIMPKHLQNMITLRFCLAALGVFYLYAYGFDVERYILLLIILLAVYTIHNFYRNRLNILTMCMLVTLKYFAPLVIFMSGHFVKYDFLVLWLSIPLIRTIEYAGKERYQLPVFKITNYESFRVKYYARLLILTVLLQQYSLVSMGSIACVTFLFFFRIAVYYMMHNKNVSDIVTANRKHNSN